MFIFISTVLVVLAVFIILGLSFNLLMGYAGQFSIAHGAFFGVGAYVTALLTRDYGWGWVGSAGVGMLVAGVLSILLGLAAAKVFHEFLVILTLAFQIAAVEFVSNLRTTGRSGGMPGIPRPDIFGYNLESTWELIFFAYGVLAIVAVALYLLMHSPFSRVLEALREDEAAARSLGKKTRAAKVYSFAISSAFAALAGSVFASFIRFVSPAEFTLERSIEVLSLTIIGGLAAYWGPFVGAAIVVLVPEALNFLGFPPTLVGALNAVIFSVFVLVLLRFRPQGLLGRKSVVIDPGVVGFEEIEETLHGNKRPGEDGADPLDGGLPSDDAAEVSEDPETDESTAEREAFMATQLEYLRKVTGLEARDSGTSDRLECEGLVKRFGGLVAVNNVSMSLEPGQVIGLVGPNGAGKTTVFNLLTGMLEPDEGKVTFGGEDIGTWAPDRRARRGVVRSFQEMRLFDGLSVQDNVLVGLTDTTDERPLPKFTHGRGASPQLIERSEELLEFIGLKGLGGVLATDLSYAEQKLLMVARLIGTGAECYLFDEPLSGLDGSGRRRVQDLIVNLATSGATVCLVEHSLEVIRQTCTRVVFLAEGRIVREGTTEEVTSDKELAEMYFGVRQ